MRVVGRNYVLLSAPLPPAGVAARARCVHEWRPRYEEEGSERVAHGAMAVSPDAWWSVLLAAPIDDLAPATAPVRVRLQRHGTPASSAAELVVEMQLPMSELDAVLMAMQGIVGQARRDGVLPPVQRAGTPTSS